MGILKFIYAISIRPIIQHFKTKFYPLKDSKSQKLNVLDKNFSKTFLIFILVFYLQQRPACQSTLFHAWETFLQEVEADSQSTSELSNLLSKQVSLNFFVHALHNQIFATRVNWDLTVKLFCIHEILICSSLN